MLSIKNILKYQLILNDNISKPHFDHVKFRLEGQVFISSKDAMPGCVHFVKCSVMFKKTDPLPLRIIMQRY